MNKKYICYCGLYCENCGVKSRVEPAGKVLRQEMTTAGFEEFIHFMPTGKEFWEFLNNMCGTGICTSCREGSGNPDCEIRICAKKKGVEMCAFCESYPCSHFDAWAAQGWTVLASDNALLREKGMDAWAKLQDERRAGNYVYAKNSEPDAK